jgi:phosphohistidine phosphatase
MKKLYIIRHAKSSWNENITNDFDRGLNHRGERDAPLMGHILKDKGIKPELIISSSAKRAKMTAEIFADIVGYKRSDILFEEELYLASVDKILEVIAQVDSKISSIFIIAHNPGLTDFVNLFCDQKIDNLPTTGVFSTELDISNWRKLQYSSGNNCNFDYPKKHL